MGAGATDKVVGSFVIISQLSVKQGTLFVATY
ncbi:uncharacterized protein METZ01_LOCUS439228 [marine metagenome]|uniref:Uncharacterized protein n=1 Tax=marine metagenome TaxID=408172 RepID=A0A382YT38_9ZZZZ